MQFLILGVLLHRPLSLYDVHKHFAGTISLFYAASFGSIQRALGQLDTHGWVRVEDAADSRRGKKLYVVTEAGEGAWREWMRSAITGSDPEPTMLARMYLLGRLPAGERPECLRVIRERIEGDAGQLHALAGALDTAEIPESVREDYRYRRATLDYGIRSHALALAWLGEMEATL